MILLELANKVILEAIKERIAYQGDRPPILEFKCSDFDGAMFHVWSGHQNTEELTISLSYSGAATLLKYGGKERLSSIFGGALVAPEGGYDVTIFTNFGELSSNNELVENIAMLKTWLCSAPLLKVMESAESGGNLPGIVDVPLKDSEERMWVKQDGRDRITAIFSVNFVDDDDAVFARVFFNEFNKSISGCPAASFTATPPGELSGITNLPRGKDVGYITVVVFDRQFNGQKKFNAAFTLVNLRNYLHYHLKCSKSHMHTRMRVRCENLLKILNRAKQQPVKTEKKTATGRTFTRK